MHEIGRPSRPKIGVRVFVGNVAMRVNRLGHVRGTPGQGSGRHWSERPLSSFPTLASPDCRHDTRIPYSAVHVHHTLVLVCGINADQDASIVVSTAVED